MRHHPKAESGARGGIDPRMHRIEADGETLPAFLQPPKFGRVVFDLSLRTAAELVSSVAGHIAAPRLNRQEGRELAEAS